jgi:type I restriction enzyme S subunit
LVDLSTIKQTWRYDAEYWHPVHIENEQIIARARERYDIKQVYDLVKRVTGSAFYPSFVGYYGDTGMPFIRVADLGDFFLNEEGMVRIDPGIIAQYRQISTIDEGDIVIAKGGSIGGVCIVQPGMGECAVCRDVIALETDPKRVDSFYLVAFLRSQFGRLQLERYKSQQVQAHLTFPAVGNVKVVVPPREYQVVVSHLIQRALAKRERAKVLYAEAEALLLAELGLDDLDLSHQPTYTQSYSQAGAAGRWDAEYFQPKYDLVETAIRDGRFPSRTLGDLIEPIRNGFDYREFTIEGTPYVRVGDVGNGRIDTKGAVKVPITIRDVDKDIGLRPGDVLFTRKGTFGNAAVVREGQEHAIVSSEIMLLRLKESHIQPDYLALFLNSEAGYQQVERRVHGVAYYSISQADLASIEIPIPSADVQARLAQLVVRSIEAENEANYLLEEAKRRVEGMVLE